ncbi:MAG: ribbon-helix-helix protein, CopG family [Myxococcales bacterium]|nr:ribbon-helix-helix protein, CopG family [Myxococcales bacterium]
MKTIQVVVDARTLKLADREARSAGVNRSALIRRAVAFYATKRAEAELAARHRAGYERKPVAPGEFDAWDAVQAWPEK